MEFSKENQPWQDRYCLHSYKLARQQILLNYTQMATILETVFQWTRVFLRPFFSTATLKFWQ